jgi:hypothetical protein
MPFTEKENGTVFERKFLTGKVDAKSGATLKSFYIFISG